MDRVYKIVHDSGVEERIQLMERFIVYTVYTPFDEIIFYREVPYRGWGASKLRKRALNDQVEAARSWTLYYEANTK